MNTTAKGSRWRRQVELWLQLQHFTTTSRGWLEPGDDITALRGSLALSLEAKDQAALHLSEWVDQATGNAPEGAVPVVVAHRKGKAAIDDAYVVMSGAAFALLLELVR